MTWEAEVDIRRNAAKPPGIDICCPTTTYGFEGPFLTLQPLTENAGFQLEKLTITASVKDSESSNHRTDRSTLLRTATEHWTKSEKR